MLIACLSAIGETTKAVTLATAGTLSTLIGDDEKMTITSLKVSGSINGTDVKHLREMAGNDSELKSTDGKLVDLDLTDANIVEGGDCYCYYYNSYYTENNKIGNYMFRDCKLESIKLPNSVTSIGSCAFQFCKGLTSVNIPNSVTRIGEDAFWGCTGLISITIPEGVTRIDSDAFYYCTGLAKVTLLGKSLPSTCATDAFDFSNIPSDATLYCKAALLEKCKVTAPWKNFKNIVVKQFSITISDAGIATGCFDDDLDFSEVTGVKAYIASGFNPTTGKVLMTNVTEVPAGTGSLVKGTEGTYMIPAAATKYMYANLLVGVLEETTVSGTEGTYTNYVLGKDNTTNEVGFYLADGTVVPANKAYLQLPTSAVTTSDNSEAKTSLRLSFDDMDDTTGITPVREQTDSANGKTVIYNLNGQRKQSLTKGLNIVNGKKIFVK